MRHFLKIAALVAAAMMLAVCAQAQTNTTLLTVPKGGTAKTAFTPNCIVFGNGTGPLACANAVNNGVLVFSGAGVPSVSTTLPNGLNLGAATATSINKVAITAPASGATLTIPDGVTLTGPAASGTAMTLGNAETVTGAKSFNSGTVILKGSSSGTTTLNASAAAGGTLTLPNATDTLVGKATPDAFLNKSFDTASTGNSFKINGTAINAVSGTGSTVCLTVSCVLSAPNLGTPSAVNLANGTNLPISTGVSGLAAGISTFLAAPSTANFVAALTDKSPTFDAVTATGQLTGNTLQVTAQPYQSANISSGSGNAAINLRAGTVDIFPTGTNGSALPTFHFLTNGFDINGVPLRFSTSGPGNYRTYLTGHLAVGTLQMGATDAAAPVAQTLQAQSVATGTANTAGQDWTFNASRGTGNAAGGKIVFNVAPAGVSGSSQNALVPALTINSDKTISLGGSLSAANLGTPSAVNLANGTNLPISTGVSGLGTGVATALGIDVGSAGAPVVNGGALGTPASGTLTNATGLPISSGVSGLGTGVATFLATPTSANLRAAITDETGTGLAYFQGGALGTPASGTLTNATGLPISTGVAGLGTGVATALGVNAGVDGAFVVKGGALGTPASGTLTNATGLPIATGVSGLGTGVATALGVNVGSAGAPVVNGGALGTPASGTLTNATGLPIATGVSGLGTGVAAALAAPSSANLRAAITDETGTGAAYFQNGDLGTPSAGVLTNASGLPTTGLVNNAVTNAKMATMANGTFKCRTTAGTGNPEDCTATQSTALLNAVVGDTGTGGTKGLVPAPGAGDAAAAKFLKADGTWAVPAGGGGGGGGMTDDERREATQGFIYQAKLFGTYRRAPKLFADGFMDGAGIASLTGGTRTSTSAQASFIAATTTASTSYANTGGTGNRTGIITASVSIASDGGVVGNLVNGDFTPNAANAFSITGGTAVAGQYIRFDFGSAVVINESKWYQNAAVGLGTWKWQASNDASSWTDIGSSFTLGGATTQTQTTLSANVTAYRYYQLIGVSGSAGGGTWNTEIEFKIGTSSVNSMTAVTTAQTADTTVSNARVLLEIDDSASPTLNTDIAVEVTCNGGTNWTAATLSSVGRGQSGRLIVETPDAACTAGTSVQARIKTFNKIVPIYGPAVTWH